MGTVKSIINNVDATQGNTKEVREILQLIVLLANLGDDSLCRGIR
ncbi:hypothetical protein [Mesobacillus zeae]|nr:hypothetical protein [Mesobacillus zeae]